MGQLKNLKKGGAEVFKKIKDFLWGVECWFYRRKLWWFENITCHFKPKNKWATDIIPNTWADKTWLIEEFLFGCIVNFVEEENAKGCIDWDYDDESKKKWRRIQKCYTFIKIGLPKLQTELSQISGKAWLTPDISYNTQAEWLEDINKPPTLPQKELQAKYIQLEKEIYDQTQATLTEIVEIRNILWT